MHRARPFVTPGSYRAVDNCNQVRRFSSGGGIPPAWRECEKKLAALRAVARREAYCTIGWCMARESVGRYPSVHSSIQSIAALPTRDHLCPLKRRPEILVDRAPVRTDSSTTSAIKESMSEPRESHGLATLLPQRSLRLPSSASYIPNNFVDKSFLDFLSWTLMNRLLKFLVIIIHLSPIYIVFPSFLNNFVFLITEYQ